MDLVTMIDILWIMTKIIIACWLMFKLVYYAKQGETTLTLAFGIILHIYFMTLIFTYK